ncbi:MAG: S8 family serine peptidase [Bacteroidia bacterium]|nr:S8 family serine peptidase [Bacteroidia bacterium]
MAKLNNWIKGLICLLFISFCTEGVAQGIYLVEFSDKSGVDFDPYEYFDAHRIERRRQMGLPISDIHDYPLRQDYVDKLGSMSDSLRYALRWLNAVSVEASSSQIERIGKLPFVRAIQELGQSMLPSESKELFEVRNDTLLDLVRGQLELDSLARYGLDGKGVRIAIFDVGFKEVPTHPSLAGIWGNGQVIHTYDFYDGDSMVYHHDMHGTQVLACIAGAYKGKSMGAGNGAEFLLARTEHRLKEKAIEEDHWLAAMEWADRLGADIINSSLGYSRKRYSFEDMDGEKTPTSKAAKIAAQKGILVVVSNGNEGARKWKYLTAPADVPEVLSVGGSFPMTPRRIPFSSFGPNAKGQIKPNVAAPGFVVGPTKKGKMDEIAGTSFSAPLVAGMMACIIQKEPELKPKQLIERIQKLGHYWPYYDYEMGYGIPKASRLFRDDPFSQKDSSQKPSFDVFYRGDSVVVRLNPEVMNDSLQRPFGPVLHVHVDGGKGKLLDSFTIPLENRDRYWYFIRRPNSKGILRIWFEEWLYEENWD